MKNLSIHEVYLLKKKLVKRQEDLSLQLNFLDRVLVLGSEQQACFHLCACVCDVFLCLVFSEGRDITGKGAHTVLTGKKYTSLKHSLTLQKN